MSVRAEIGDWHKVKRQLEASPTHAEAGVAQIEIRYDDVSDERESYVVIRFTNGYTLYANNPTFYGDES